MTFAVWAFCSAVFTYASAQSAGPLADDRRAGAHHAVPVPAEAQAVDLDRHTTLSVELISHAVPISESILVTRSTSMPEMSKLRKLASEDR